MKRAKRKTVASLKKKEMTMSNRTISCGGPGGIYSIKYV